MCHFKKWVPVPKRRRTPGPITTAISQNSVVEPGQAQGLPSPEALWSLIILTNLSNTFSLSCIFFITTLFSAYKRCGTSITGHVQLDNPLDYAGCSCLPKVLWKQRHNIISENILLNNTHAKRQSLEGFWQDWIKHHQVLLNIAILLILASPPQRWKILQR